MGASSKYAVVETLDHRAGGSKSQVQVGIYCTKVSIDTLVLIARNTDTKVP